jgi:hypothetical protein
MTDFQTKMAEHQEAIAVAAGWSYPVYQAISGRIDAGQSWSPSWSHSTGIDRDTFRNVRRYVKKMETEILDHTTATGENFNSTSRQAEEDLREKFEN